MKIVSVIGARPQFIKYSPLTKELRKVHRDILIHTGQHYDYEMNKVFFDDLGIPPADYNLGIGSGSHAYQTGEMLKGIEEVLIKEKPDLLMIYGDTNSTIAGALAAVKLHVRVAHIEAGLRSFDRSMPEEINRIITDHCSDYLFCPTQTAVDNLNKEGISSGVHLTGDVMVDVLDANKEMAEQSDVLKDLGLTSKHYILITIHRSSNTDIAGNLRNIVMSLIQISEMGEKLVFPIHPRTKKLLDNYGLLGRLKEKVKVIEPLGYYDFLKLLNHARKVLTDSGGIQKEAYVLYVPCITLRDNTEWTETVQYGWNVLAGTDNEEIVRLFKEFNPTEPHPDIFGIEPCKNILRLLNCVSST